MKPVNVIAGRAPMVAPRPAEVLQRTATLAFATPGIEAAKKTSASGEGVHVKPREGSPRSIKPATSASLAGKRSRQTPRNCCCSAFDNTAAGRNLPFCTCYPSANGCPQHL